MVFNYSFQTLSPEDKALRRQTLDHHALVTFLSCSVAPLGAVVLVRLARLLLARLPALLDGRGRESYKALGSPAVTDWQPGHGRSESAVSTATDLGFACELNGDGDGEVGGADSGGGSGSGGSGSGRGRVGGASRASVSAGTPRSRKFNGRRPSASLATILDTRLRQIRWWLRQGVQIRGYDCGARFQWVFGILWTVWLVFQCLVATGDGKIYLSSYLFLSLLISSYSVHDVQLG